MESLMLQMIPLQRRMKALKTLLSLPQSTSKAKPYSEWELPPQIHLEIEDAKLYYDDK